MIGIKRFLFLVSPFLIASCVLGEKESVEVEIDAMARQLPTDDGIDFARILPGTSRATRSSNSSAEEDDGTSSADTSSSNSSSVDTSSAEDDDEEGPSGKSSKTKSGKKGKTSKSESSLKSSKSKSSSIKSSKSKSEKSKSSKSTSTSDTSTDGSGDDEPSPAPVNFEPATGSPTSADSIDVAGTPFALLYTLEEAETMPTSEDLSQLAEVTRAYLEEFFIDFYSTTQLTILEDFLTFMIRDSFTVGEPVQADYRSTALFAPATIFLPSVPQLDQAINDALSGDNLAIYLSRVQALPSGNVFSTTTGIGKGIPEVPLLQSGTASASSSMFAAGIVSTAAGIVVLAAGVALLRRQPEDEEAEFDQTQTKHSDATVTGETCTTSVDGSSAFRRSGKFNTDSLNEAEFEDEPLDGDDGGNDSMRHPSISSAAT